jgi:acetoin utilization protein AcuC
VGVYAGAALGSYGFGAGHPFGPDRHDAFVTAFEASPLASSTRRMEPVAASREAVLRFHKPEYVDLVEQLSVRGDGLLDAGDTPAAPGIYESALTVVGCVLDAVTRIMSGELRRAFVPIAGLHHARPGSAAGFCVFNDCAIAIETLLRVHGLQRVAYVDIDAHHGDGVFYAFAEDPKVTIVDFHEDGRWLYPGTGSAAETGLGPARATKLNVPLPPRADDALFFRLWPTAESFLDASRPEFVLLQCGGDCLAGDPLTHLALSDAVHHDVTAALCRLADRHCHGRLLAMGGGGYHREQTARAWVQAVRAMVETSPDTPARGAP